MMLAIKKRLCYLFLGRNHTMNDFFLRFSTKISATQRPNPPPNTNSMADYLVSQLGFSQERATRSAKYLTSLKSVQKAEAVIGFLRDHGFSQADVKGMVIWYPKLLSSCPDKTLLPNMQSLAHGGLPNPLLNQIIVSNPRALVLRSAIARIQFWRSFLEFDDVWLVRLFKRNRNIVALGLDSCISPRLSLLKDLGFSTNVIRVMATYPHFLSSSLATIKAQLQYTEKLGFSRDSRMFVHGLAVVAFLRKETILDKIKVYGKLGWSEKDLSLALLKAPNIIRLSENNIAMKMDFFVRVAGLPVSYIVARPVLLLLSLEKRLIPRYYILQTLESKGILRVKRGIFTVMMLTEEQFLEEYVHKYESQIAGHKDAYLTARDRNELKLCTMR